MPFWMRKKSTENYFIRRLADWVRLVTHNNFYFNRYGYLMQARNEEM